MNRQQRRAAKSGRDNLTGDWTSDDVSDILTDPACIGIGGYPAVVDDEMWIRANVRVIEDMGPEAFLRNLIHQLRKYDT